MSQVPLIDVDPRVRRELPRPVDFHSREVIGRRATRRNHFVTLALPLVLLSCPCLAADTPGASLTKSFQAAKAALAAQDMVHAEQHYRETIALGLRQLGNLAISENQFDQATQYLDDAVKFTPQDNTLQV